MTASSKQISAPTGMTILNSTNTLSVLVLLTVFLAACTKTYKPPYDFGLQKASTKKPSGQPGLFSLSSLPASALIPDLQTVVPQHLQVVRAHQRDILRFSNGVANTGAGALQFKPEFPIGGIPGSQNAIQQLLDASGAVVHQETVSQFEYHPEHHHWHIDAVALFEIRRLSPNGPVVGGNAIKTTFCLIDWVKLNDNSNSKERMYFDCFGELQGISSGWVDQYNQAIEGQELDITGVAEGTYYLVSTANPEHTFIETNPDNNAAWTSFDLRRDKQGHPKITITGHSNCVGGMCGYSPNR